ncbi:hypothetical protein Arcve_1582 [Archaeoglobus veneficus SNP6]|uniref:KaiC-like domain-containing protein n=2 Tax=Archaeoglobus veneficus TaxID=58290 RepID=F2KPQ4_ARCVS|nr:hypothetical protein Arcve_1582 [Archaeoglobus veneficus SNP6]
MFSSGTALDRLLGGGVEEGRTVLVETVGGLGEEVVLGFIVNALRNGRKVLILLGKRRMRDMIRFVGDGSGSYEMIAPENGDISLEELYTIGDSIRRRNAELVVFFLLSSLLVLHKPDKVFAFCTDLCNHIRSRNSTAIFTLDKALSDMKTRAMFEESSDVVIEIEEIIEGFNIRRGIRVKKNPIAPPTDYYELKLTNGGIEIGERIL